MSVYQDRISLQTKGNSHMLDITNQTERIVSESGLRSGICTVFCVGSTGSIITIEFEGGLIKDFPEAMERIAPEGASYEHELRWHDGNGHSHVKASIIGPSLTVPFTDGKLTLGTWQQIAFVDFDSKPRSRNLEVTVLGE
ncbi:MAG: YjbQ family protein [Candidatus Thorarchaeota archaeon]|nr:MAG: YjbQ family protein [Candidatus Thorarchaeota archaeon]